MAVRQDIEFDPLVDRSVKRLLSSFLVLVCFEASASAGMKVYYLRHAQSGANVEHEWTDISRSQWPPYVGDENSFSPRGEEQVAVIPEKLSGYQFDFIAVSPKWRSCRTILGFLERNHRKAEIWPELEEFGIDKLRAHELLAAGALPGARPDLFSGPEVVLPDDESASFFSIRANGKRRFRLRDGVDERIEDCVNSLKGAIALIGGRGDRGDGSILLVGHGISGRLLLHMLVKDEGELPSIENARLWMAEEQPDGSFELKMYNDKPVGSQAAAR